MVRRLSLAAIVSAVPTLVGCGVLLGAELDDLAPKTGADGGGANDDPNGDRSSSNEDPGSIQDENEGGAAAGAAAADAGAGAAGTKLDSGGGPSATPPPRNPIINGDFETGENGWFGWQKLAVRKAACSLKEGGAGKYASLEPRSEALNNMSCSINQYITIPYGTKVTLTFMVRGIDPARKTSLQVRFGNDTLYSEAAPAPADGFVAKSVSLTSRATLSGTLFFNAVTTIQVGDALEIDKVAIVTE